MIQNYCNWILLTTTKRRKKKERKYKNQHFQFQSPWRHQHEGASSEGEWPHIFRRGWILQWWQPQGHCCLLRKHYRLSSCHPGKKLHSKKDWLSNEITVITENIIKLLSLKPWVLPNSGFGDNKVDQNGTNNASEWVSKLSYETFLEYLLHVHAIHFLICPALLLLKSSFAASIFRRRVWFSLVPWFTQYLWQLSQRTTGKFFAIFSKKPR